MDGKERDEHPSEPFGSDEPFFPEVVLDVRRDENEGNRWHPREEGDKAGLERRGEVGREDHHH